MCKKHEVFVRGAGHQCQCAGRPNRQEVGPLLGISQGFLIVLFLKGLKQPLALGRRKPRSFHINNQRLLLGGGGGQGAQSAEFWPHVLGYAV